MATEPPGEDPFPCKLTIRIPFPTPHLAVTALRALRVDQEISAFVTRSFSLARATDDADAAATNTLENPETVLVVLYATTTNRMLRVAVKGFFDSLGVVLHCMEELDVDVVQGPVTQSLEGVQGLEEVVTK